MNTPARLVLIVAVLVLLALTDWFVTTTVYARTCRLLPTPAAQVPPPMGPCAGPWMTSLRSH